MTTQEEQTAQEWENEWWGTCTNTFGEEAKQITYAHRMGLVNNPQDGKWPVYDLNGYSVLDLGGGPTSMLLKTVGGWGAVVDPCPYPDWVAARYAAAGVFYHVETAESFVNPYDAKLSECWIYNVLQHVEDPEKVIATAKKCAHLLRMFEWVETETNIGHPHSLHADELNRWVDGTGTVEPVNENGAVGLAYYGTFVL
jgi:hypothetical protein